VGPLRCCGGGAGGPPAAAPPSSPMNSRLLMSNMELPPWASYQGDKGFGSRAYAPTHTIAHHGCGENAALRDFNAAYVADGDKSDLSEGDQNVCSTLRSGHR